MPGTVILSDGTLIPREAFDKWEGPASYTPALTSPLQTGVPVNPAVSYDGIGGGSPANSQLIPVNTSPMLSQLIPVAGLPGISVPVGVVLNAPTTGTGRMTQNPSEANKIIINVENQLSNASDATGGTATNVQGLESGSRNVEAAGNTLWIILIAVAAIVAVVVFRR